MHTDISLSVLYKAALERSRRAWWTVYILDREMTSLCGVPQSIHDDDVNTALPAFSGSTQKRQILAMRIRLSRAITKINRSIDHLIIAGYALANTHHSCLRRRW